MDITVKLTAHDIIRGMELYIAEHNECFADVEFNATERKKLLKTLPASVTVRFAPLIADDED